MKMEGIELYPHNQKAYDNLCAMLRDNNRACVVQPTGTGKFVIIAKMAQDNPGKNFLLLGTNDYMYIDQMANLSDIAPGFTPKNLQFMTYATAMAKEKAAAARAESAPYRVVCLETGTRYKTYADAGRDLGVEEGNIQQAVKSKSHYSRGYHFINSDEYSTLAKGEIENILKKGGKSRTVVCVETGKRYESIKAASGEYGDRLGSARSRIGLCCKNPNLTFDGKHWCYPDDLESRIDNAEEYTVPRKTAVRCLETGKMYESIADASRDTGINYNSIGSVARGNRHKAGGYTWEYVNPAPDKRDNRGCNQPTAKKVRCAETGNQFVSLSDAARAVGLRNGNSIRRAIDRGGTAGGYHWEYLDEKKEVSTDDHHQADGRAE